MVKRPKHEEVKKRMLQDPEVKKYYDELAEEYELINEFVKARKKADKTQAEIAERMNTTVSVISRIENAGGNKRHSPSLATLRRYAKALGCRLRIRLVRV